MNKKKMKLITAAAAAVLAAGSLMGCSSELSNEYVTVPQYKGLEVPQPAAATVEITDDQVEQLVESRVAATAERSEITDRAAQSGDIVNIDYTGYVDGTAFDGGSATGADLELGSGSFIGANGDYQGFEDQIVGHQTGEEFDITVQFPDTYAEEMAGKVADFHIVLNGIYTETVPELTDEWVQSNSTESENVDEFRQEMRDLLESQSEESAHSELASSVQTTLLDSLEIKSYPEDVVDEYAASLTDSYEQLAEMYGTDMEGLLTTYLQTTEEDFNARIEEIAQRTAIFDEAVKLIAEKEGLDLTEEEYQEKIEEYAEENGAEDVDQYLESVGESAVRATILRDIVTDYLIDECVQVEQE